MEDPQYRVLPEVINLHHFMWPVSLLGQIVPFRRSALWKFNVAQVNANGALPGGFAKLHEVRHATLCAEWMQSDIFGIPTWRQPRVSLMGWPSGAI